MQQVAISTLPRTGAEDLVVPYLISDLDTCMRVTHVVKMKSNELRKRQVAGLYRDIELQPTKANSSDTQTKENEISGSTDTYSEEEFNIFRKRVFGLILATDMKRHNDDVSGL